SGDGLGSMMVALLSAITPARTQPSEQLALNAGAGAAPRPGGRSDGDAGEGEERPQRALRQAQRERRAPCPGGTRRPRRHARKVGGAASPARDAQATVSGRRAAPTEAMSTPAQASAAHEARAKAARGARPIAPQITRRGAAATYGRSPP